MDTRLYSLLDRLENNPSDQLAWQQVKRQIKKQPEETLCLLFFGRLADSAGCLTAVLSERWLDIFGEMLVFYRAFIERTRNYGDVWGGGREFWFVIQFLEVWAQKIKYKVSVNKAAALDSVLRDLRNLAGEHTIPDITSQLGLPFLPQEVAWNLTLYLEPSVILVLQAKWAYAVYISLEKKEWGKHPFVRRLLANSYWEARAAGQIASTDSCD